MAKINKEYFESNNICIGKFLAALYKQLFDGLEKGSYESELQKEYIERGASYIADITMMNVVGRWCECESCLEIYKENKKSAKDMNGFDL